MKMNSIVWVCVFAVVAVQSTIGNADEASLTNELKLSNFSSSCFKPGHFCKSCSELVMCIETEYGFTEQFLETCSGSNTCNNDACTSERNVFCDGTANIPFKCHVPGAFPDPFDCMAYHFCVLTTEIDENGKTVDVIKDFKQECSSGHTQWDHRYDAKSTYCKYEIRKGCTELPVPVCKYPGDTDALIENDSIYYVCEAIDNMLYPNLYACPYGGRYNRYYERCEIYDDSNSTTVSPTTTSEYTTTKPTTTSEYTTTKPTTKVPYTTTTEYPYTTTEYPYTTTEYPESTTAYPDPTTTEYPYTTPEYPESTTGYPDPTTPEYPYSTPEYPYTTTDYPYTTTGYPESTPRYTEYTTGYPEYTTYKYGRK